MRLHSNDFSTTFLLDSAADGSPGEGHRSELSRHVSAAMLMPRGRPGAWLLFVVAVCAYVVVNGFMVGFA